MSWAHHIQQLYAGLVTEWISSISSALEHLSRRAFLFEP